MNVAVQIMTHAARGDRAQALARRAGCLRITTDWRSEGAWPTARRCWRAGYDLDDWATHVLVLQDDAKVCADFYDTLHALVNARAEAALSLFGHIGPFVRVRELGLHWAAMRLRHTGVAHVLPRDWVSDMLRWVEAEEPRRRARWQTRSDIRVVEYVREVRQQPMYVPVPNPVDHRGDLPSLLGHIAVQGWTSPVFEGEHVPLAARPWGKLEALCECGAPDEVCGGACVAPFLIAPEDRR